jgi:hypothetical protein
MSDVTEGCCHHNACGQRGYCMINRIEELEAKLREAALQELSSLNQADEARQAQLDAEAKLAKAVEALEGIVTDNTWDKTYMKCRKVLRELKGGKDE